MTAFGSILRQSIACNTKSRDHTFYPHLFICPHIRLACIFLKGI
ncbi:hypothetical protein V6Z11_D11G388600 [Gossypium hirsutum]